MSVTYIAAELRSMGTIANDRSKSRLAPAMIVAGALLVALIGYMATYEHSSSSHGDMARIFNTG